ncbi:MAG: CRISPR system precrRNA processing endoribonuclease RAMP protein Cas6 [Acetobacteraceae bacterium]|nr:CRISPR system precrRNA processing endoribonuclease RAMP protein Cas6 [Acetobacteraceae bacterium]
MSGSLLLAAPVVRVDAWFTPARDLALQAYPGSAWRGAFGHALKRAVCVMRQRPCAGCALSGVCLFPHLFGTVSATDEGQHGHSPLGHSPPVPFVLAPAPMPRSGVVPAGTPLRVRLMLLAPATGQAIYALRGLIDAAEQGLGPARVPLALSAIAPAGAPPQPPGDTAIAAAITPHALVPPPIPARAMALRLATPLRLRLEGDLLTRRSFAPHHLVAAALRRTTGLFGSPDAATRRQLLDHARALAWTSPRFGWLETVRRSTRQQATMRLGGIVGTAELDLSKAAALWPVLWSASVLHVGKGASMGFGQIDLTGTEHP